MFHRTVTAATFPALAVILFASFSHHAFGWNHESKPEAHDAEVAKFVSQKLQIWQDRMNLKDWNIKVNLLPADKLEPKTLGNVHWDTDLKTADIGVLAPQDYKLPYKAMLDDMELTIVHELVHIELASLPRSEASRRNEEHTVNEISGALLRLSRNK
jgi:hypothetical protein